jgi:phosphate starvation-inducible PhoH-like protein
MSSKRKPKNLDFGQLDLVELTSKQYLFYKTILKNQITFGTGPAGSSKTFTSCYTALKLFAKGTIKKIIITKPIEESGEKLGFLPGDIENKIGPYMESFLLTMKKMLPTETVEFLLEQEVIEMRPLAYMRGATFDNSLMILDESQNADFRQLMLYITRMGKNSKVLITGDTSQYDISENRVSLLKFISMINDVESVEHFKFGREDIVRSKILIDITDRYEKFKADI